MILGSWLEEGEELGGDIAHFLPEGLLEIAAELFRNSVDFH
jgi:hypothetical protein